MCNYVKRTFLDLCIKVITVYCCSTKNYKQRATYITKSRSLQCVTSSEVEAGEDVLQPGAVLSVLLYQVDSLLYRYVCTSSSSLISLSKLINVKRSITSSDPNLLFTRAEI